MPTLGQLIDTAIARLRETSPTPRIDVEALALHVFQLTRAALIARAADTPPPVDTERFLACVERRHAGEPIAYITDHREFWSLDLSVSPATLIPRPETELLVEQALAHIPADAAHTVFDLGTGSGAIALAIAHERPRARVIATDCSRDALAVATANAARLRLANVEFRHGDWFAPLADLRAHLIVSNPPYVRADDPHLARGDVRFEPRAALVAGEAGLAALRHLIHVAPRYLYAAGWLLVEHGAEQADDVGAMFRAVGFTDLAHFQDLQEHRRVSSARHP